nr:hypothetical protein [Tanacetum cinerariifolium]
MGGVGCGVASAAVNMVVTMVVLVWRGRRRLGDVDDGEGDEGDVDGWVVVSRGVGMDRWRGGWWSDPVPNGLAEKVWRRRKNFGHARKLRGRRKQIRLKRDKSEQKRTKPDKNGKRVEAGKSLKRLQ